MLLRRICAALKKSRTVPQSPGGTPASIQDRQDPTPSVTELSVSASQGFPEPATLPASPGAVRQANRDGTIVDSLDYEPFVQRVSSVPAGSFGSVLWDSQKSNEIVGPTRVAAVPGSRLIDRRTRRRLNLVWRAPDPVPVQNEADDAFASRAPFVEELGERWFQSELVWKSDRKLWRRWRTIWTKRERERKCQWLTPAVRRLSGTDSRFLSRQ